MITTLSKFFGSSIFAAALCISAAAQDVSPETSEKSEPEQSAAKELGFQQVFGEGMLDAYENKTMEGIYQEFAADMAAGRKPVTFTETHHDNATTTYNHRSESEDYTIKGIYTVQKDTICYYYNSPGKVTGSFCFYVFLNESCYYHFYAPEGLPITVKDFEGWSSMAYAKEDAGTCLPNIA